MVPEFSSPRDNVINKNILTVIACHTDSRLKVRALIHNLKYFFELSTSISIINSDQFRSIHLEKKIKEQYKNIIINDYLTDEQCEYYKNSDMNNDLKSLNNDQLREYWISFGKKENVLFINTPRIYFDYLPNDKFVCHGKWIYYLNKIDYNHFNNIILTNDSFLITRSLFDFKELIHPEKDLVALLESYEIKHHYPDFLRAYNRSGTRKILEYYEKNKQNITDFYSVIVNYEVNSSDIFDNVDVLYKVNSNITSNIHFNNDLLRFFLYNRKYPVIKIKKMQLNFYNFTTLPSDFNSIEYIMLHSDLNGFSPTKAKNHFLHFGIKEGRFYKKNQVTSLPKFIERYLTMIGFPLRK